LAFTSSRRLITRETVLIETFARFATSSMELAMAQPSHARTGERSPGQIVRSSG